MDESFMVLAIGAPALTAAATSEFGMAVTNFAAAASRGFLGNIPWGYAVPLDLVVVTTAGSRLRFRSSLGSIPEQLAEAISGLMVVIHYS